MLEMLKQFYNDEIYLEFRLHSGKVLDGFITGISWDDMNDVIRIVQPLSKQYFTFSLDDIEKVEILKP